MIEIQIGDTKGSNVFFQPMAKVLRGTFDLNNVKEPRARLLITKFPKPIPGVILRLDGTAATIVEPLYRKEHAGTRERIESMSLRLPPEEQETVGVHVPTFAYWMKRLVDGGSAKIVSGTWPEFDPKQAKKSFITEPVVSEREDLVDKLLAMVTALVSDRQGRKEPALAGGK